MVRDLDTLLRDAVVRTPVDTADVLVRGRRRRRRTAATRAVGALAVLGVVAGGVTVALDGSPRPPVIATEPDASFDGALPVVVAEAVDPEGLLLRAVVDPAVVPDWAEATSATRTNRGTWALLAVGSDGTRVVDTERATAEVRRPDGTVVEVAGRPAAAAALEDGSVLVVTGPDGEAGAPVTATEVHLVDGDAVTSSTLAMAFPLERGRQSAVVVLQDPDRVRLATGTGAVGWRSIELWRADRGVVTDAPVAAVAAADVGAWRLDGPTGSVGQRNALDSVARGDGLVLDVAVDGTDPANTFGQGSTGPQVVDGRIAFTRQAASGTRGLAYAAVLGGPGNAIVVPLVAESSEEGGARPELGILGRVFLSADGALWFGDTAHVERLTPADTLPPGGPVTHDRPLATLPEPPSLDTVGGPGVVVTPPGGVAEAPTEAVDGVLLQELGADCCGRVYDVAPDGSLLSSAGVTAIDGSTRPLDGLDGLWSTDLGAAWSRLAAFDEDGAVWALDDRWWSTAAFPDLVVARPGETAFTSVGHVPLRDLLGVDVSDVVLDVRGDEVALVSTATDPAGNTGPGHRVVLVRDGEPLSAADREATVGRLPGRATGIDGSFLMPGSSGQRGRGPLTASAGTQADPSDPDGSWTWSLRGPLLGPDGVPGIVQGLGGQPGPVEERWVGGGVVATVFRDRLDPGPIPTPNLTLLLSRQDGATAAVRLPPAANAFALDVVVAADGSVVVVSEDSTATPATTRVLRVLDPDWSPAG